MSLYTKEKFQSLNDRRQAEVFLNCLYKLEADNLENSNLDEALIYLQCLQGHEELHRLLKMQDLLCTTITPRQLLNFIVPTERYLQRNLKDSQIAVSHRDKEAQEGAKLPIFVVLDHLRSSLNVGNIFRTAECMGVQHIFLVGYTPTPNDLGVRKTAMGTTERVSWSQHPKLSEVLEKLKSQSMFVVALETADSAEKLEDFNCPPQGVALLFGNERFGLDGSALESVDKLVQIPMLGAKNSLNVSNAFSIVAYEVAKQLRVAFNE